MRHILPLLALLSSTPVLAQSRSPDRQQIDPHALEQTVRTLASDTFEGRAPGSRGEAMTVGYLIARLQALGLEPAGTEGGWTQTVPLLHTRLGTPEKLGVAIGGQWTDWQRGREVYLSTIRPEDKAVIDAAPLVFVGYGVKAPERGWDDFKGVDLMGKVAVFLVNDPDFESKPGEPVAGKFGGRTMTYYGRWTYKFEEAARQGAVGALIVHDTPGAGYGWSVVTAPQGENFDIERTPDKLSSLRLQGWVEGEAASSLFRAAGLDLAKLRLAARASGFRPVEMKGARFSAAIPVQHEIVESRNVLAKISGASAPQEAVMFGAHWDAYGIGEPDKDGKTVRGGANDDAMGVAGLLEIARLMKAGPAPRRTALFAFWTAEERGLLGSEYYAANPLFPAEKIAANLTIDVLQTAGKAKDVLLIGKGQSSMEDDLARFAQQQGRVVTVENLPERGLFYRADHFSFAKRGVPVLLFMGLAGAQDLVDGGREAGQAWIDAYTGECYHKACDAWTPQWKWEGAVQDIDLTYRIGADLANSARWPDWKPGSEFKQARDATRAARP